MSWVQSLVAGLVLCASLGGAFALAALAPGWALWGFIGLIFLIPLGWMFVSALLPVVEDRNCPSCGEWALEPLDPADRYGVRCTACGHEDPSIPGARLGHEPPARKPR